MQYMNITNYIEFQYRELTNDINIEYIDLYESFPLERIRQIFSSLHHLLIINYQSMNNRLPTGEYTAHFWADPSRELIRTIEIINGLQRVLKNSDCAFSLDSYYTDVIEKSRKFLSGSGGSEIPPHMDKVELYYTLPIFLQQNSIHIESELIKQYANLKLIGEGSYAYVFKYKDPFYQKSFVLKRTKNDLNTKEIERFKLEFEQMKELYSPYIVEVFCYDDSQNEYVMECMDYSLDKYIEKNNSNLGLRQRKNIVNQILRAFQYIHSKGLLHRDISPKNILLKLYEDVLVVKVADFGLVKIPDSQLTTANTEFKGYFNDPELVVEGFNTYNVIHETYALTRIVYFIMTGRTNVSDIKNFELRAFVKKGLSSDKSNRFQNVEQMIEEFKKI